MQTTFSFYFNDNGSTVNVVPVTNQQVCSSIEFTKIDNRPGSYKFRIHGIDTKLIDVATVFVSPSTPGYIPSGDVFMVNEDGTTFMDVMVFVQSAKNETFIDASDVIYVKLELSLNISNQDFEPVRSQEFNYGV